MAKGYGRKNVTPHRGGASKQLLVVLVCFLLGYLSASVFDFTSVSGWVNTQLFAQHSAQIKPVKEQARLPKPKFEFYTLLASEHAQSKEQVASTGGLVAAPQPVPTQIPSMNVPTVRNKPEPSILANVVDGVSKPLPAQAAPSPAVRKDSYLVQMASFKSRQEAERMKASLTLKGFAVNIATVTQQQVTWYRVVVGPFATRPQAEKIRVSIARSEHIVGMIRKMNA